MSKSRVWKVEFFKIEELTSAVCFVLWHNPGKDFTICMHVSVNRLEHPCITSDNLQHSYIYTKSQMAHVYSSRLHFLPLEPSHTPLRSLLCLFGISFLDEISNKAFFFLALCVDRRLGHSFIAAHEVSCSAKGSSENYEGENVRADLPAED